MTFGTDHLPMLVLLAQIKVKAENIYCFHPAMKGMSQMAILRLHLERIMCLFFWRAFIKDGDTKEPVALIEQNQNLSFG
jgi:hypothetical protein